MLVQDSGISISIQAYITITPRLLNAKPDTMVHFHKENGNIYTTVVSPHISLLSDIKYWDIFKYTTVHGLEEWEVKQRTLTPFLKRWGINWPPWFCASAVCDSLIKMYLHITLHFHWPFFSTLNHTPYHTIALQFPLTSMKISNITKHTSLAVKKWTTC